MQFGEHAVLFPDYSENPTCLEKAWAAVGQQVFTYLLGKALS